jgi:hypothetical protein
MPVSFDGPNKLIIATPGTTTLNVAEDIYSAWKQWSVLSDNLKYAQALRVVGGDPTVGANRISGYFFLMNGWKLRPQEANHTLTIDGILLVDGGGDPFVSTLGAYNVRINQITPLQAETIAIDSGGGTALTPEEIAQEVWNTMLVNHQLDGSSGKALSTASTGGVDVNVLASAVWTHSSAQALQLSIARIQAIEEGSWKIDGTQMIFYALDGLTEVARFDLLDDTGTASNEKVFERRKVV